MWFRKGETTDRVSVRGRTVALGGIGTLAAVVTLVASCSRDTTAPKPTSVTAYGAPVAVGNGNARSYLVLADGTPTELGIALSAGALDGLPQTPVMGGYEFLLPFPAGNTTQYQVIGLNWNPAGHPPPMVYTVPHFDFHFYMMTLADRNAIVPSDPTFATKAANLPPEQLRPSGYVADIPANAVPQMGLHWTDSTAAEFHGQPFTRTFINGSWNGAFTFLEPMVTRAYLLTHPDDLIPVRSTSQHALAGYYPKAYRVSWDAADSEWHVALASLAR